MIVWRITQADPAIASMRYRAVLPALHLSKLGYVSRFSTRGESLPNLLGVEALIFVKAFSKQDLKVAQAAHRRGIPVILDICDNIFVEGYSYFGAHPDTFRQMTAIASVIVTPGSELARVIRNEADNSTPVMIVPDGVETKADRERIARVLADWQLYSAAMRVYFRVRTQMREQGVLFTTVPTLVSFGAITSFAQKTYRSCRRTVKDAKIFSFARAIYRSYGRGVKHTQILSQIVVRRIREEGPRWVIRGIVRRTRSLIEQLGSVTRVPPIAAGVPSVSNHSSKKKPRSANGSTNGTAAPAGMASSVENAGDPDSASAKHTLIWYGNHGAFYGQFGLEDLARLRPALCTIAERHPIRLIVVSNSYARFNDLIRPFPFSTQYVPWRSGVVERLFEESEVALLPNSLDPFSVCKSANRAILALYHGIPVVATRTPALEPFADCMVFDDWVGGVEAYLNDPQLAQQHVAVARPIIEREFGGKRIATGWDAILRRVGTRGRIS